jgi:hypothetical protein
VREVAVHLQDQIRAVRERAVEAGDVRGSEALLALAVEDGDEGELSCQAVGYLARTVR